MLELQLLARELGSRVVLPIGDSDAGDLRGSQSRHIGILAQAGTHEIKQNRARVAGLESEPDLVSVPRDLERITALLAQVGGDARLAEARRSVPIEHGEQRIARANHEARPARQDVLYRIQSDR